MTYSNVSLCALLLLFFPSTCAVSLAQSGTSPITQTESGAVSGVLDDGLTIYKGVPFAAPPVGDLRWRAPTPAARWVGTRKADTFAPACMQEGVSMPGEVPPPASEDCLYLNIWTPVRSTHE
jgi:para-nitrobenzyl esterase